MIGGDRAKVRPRAPLGGHRTPDNPRWGKVAKAQRVSRRTWERKRALLAVKRGEGGDDGRGRVCRAHAAWGAWDHEQKLAISINSLKPGHDRIISRARVGRGEGSGDTWGWGPAIGFCL